MKGFEDGFSGAEKADNIKTEPTRGANTPNQQRRPPCQGQQVRSAENKRMADESEPQGRTRCTG